MSKQEDNTRNAVDSISTYICTIYKSIHFIVMIVLATLCAVVIQQFPNSMSVSFLLLTVVYVVAITALYYICKRVKSKKAYLNVKRLSIAKRAGFITLSVVVSILAVIANAILAVYITSISK